MVETHFSLQNYNKYLTYTNYLAEKWIFFRFSAKYGC